MPKKERMHVAFRIPPELKDRTDKVLRKVRDDPTPRAHADELAEIIVELTHTGLDSYFVAPLERIGIGAFALGTAKVGVKTAATSLPALVRRIVGNMTDEQLHRLVEVMDEMFV